MWFLAMSAICCYIYTHAQSYHGSTEKNDHSIGRLSHTHQKSCGESCLSRDIRWVRLNFCCVCNANSPVAGIISAKCENKYSVQYVFDRAWTSYFWWK